MVDEVDGVSGLGVGDVRAWLSLGVARLSNLDDRVLAGGAGRSHSNDVKGSVAVRVSNRVDRSLRTGRVGRRRRQHEGPVRFDVGGQDSVAVLVDDALCNVDRAGGRGSIHDVIVDGCRVLVRVGCEGASRRGLHEPGLRNFCNGVGA